MSMPPRSAPFWPRSLPRDDDTRDWLSIAAILLCLLLSFFFAGSETALTASSRAAMLRLEKDGNRNAGIVNRLLAARERLIGALLLGNNAVNIAGLVARDQRVPGLVRRRRRDLRDRADDGAGRGVRRGAAEDRRLQRARPHGAAGGAPDGTGWCGCSARC